MNDLRNIKNISFVELAGLPGAGKSTTLRALRKEIGNSKLKFTRIYVNSRFKLLISLPFIPYVIIRFYRVFKTLVVAKVSNKKIKIRLRTVLSILAILTSSTMEYWIARFESTIMRKKVFLDGGFIQWSLSIWIRSPIEIQEILWKAYLTHIPNNILCIVLECDPNEALRRAKSREEGVPGVMTSREWNTKEGSDLVSQYQKMHDLLKSEAVQSKVDCIYINSETDASSQANMICKNIKKFILIRKLVLY